MVTTRPGAMMRREGRESTIDSVTEERENTIDSVSHGQGQTSSHPDVDKSSKSSPTPIDTPRIGNPNSEYHVNRSPTSEKIIRAVLGAGGGEGFREFLEEEEEERGAGDVEKDMSRKDDNNIGKGFFQEKDIGKGFF